MQPPLGLVTTPRRLPGCAARPWAAGANAFGVITQRNSFAGRPEKSRILHKQPARPGGTSVTLARSADARLRRPLRVVSNARQHLVYLVQLVIDPVDDVVLVVVGLQRLDAFRADGCPGVLAQNFVDSLVRHR